ncbi:hypothetical protein BURK1_01483 [Burkholderiales bacterium]|nr:hypothetical protein BURK1_01483 [Burkholderiales bacterium]
MAGRGPDFLCIGMEKAGTGWLHDQCSHAAGAWMTPIKELNYFCGDPFTAFNLHRVEELKRRADLSPRDRAFVRAFEGGRGRGADAAWYRALFAMKDGLVSGDVSPNYAMAGAREIEAAVRECPGARYVLLLRHPVRRLWSALCMRVRKGQATQAELLDASRVAALAAQPEHAERSYPTRIWAKWSAAVPPGAAGYWFLEDIADDPVRVRDEILAFVGLRGAAVSIAPDYNRKRNAWKLAMPPGVERRLMDIFGDEIAACAERFGGRALEWRPGLGSDTAAGAG